MHLRLPRLTLLLVALGLAFARPSKAVQCGLEGCVPSVEDLAACAPVVAVVEVDVGGEQLADVHVVEAVRGVKAGDELRLFRRSEPQALPRVMLPGERELLVATDRFEFSDPRVRHERHPASPGPRRVLELTTRDVPCDRPEAATEAAAKLRQLLALPAEQRRQQRVRGQARDLLGCGRRNNTRELGAFAKKWCARVDHDPLEKLIAEFKASASSFHAFSTALELTASIGPDACDVKSDRGVAFSAYLRAQRRAHPIDFIHAPDKGWDAWLFENALDALTAAPPTPDPLLAQFSAAASSSVRAAAGTVDARTGHPAEARRLLRELSGHDTARKAVAFALARTGDKDALTVALEFREGGSKSGDDFEIFRRRAELLVANSAPASGGVHELVCAPTGLRFEPWRWAKIWRESRDRTTIRDAWPDFDDAPLIQF